MLSKSIVQVKNRFIMKLGDKELDYNPDFKFYITTRLGNPHYTPEISTKTTICNFAVKQQARPSLIPSLRTRFTRAGIEWRR